jgi:hypothetical protein
VNLGAPSAYLDGERIISVAKQQGCQALHPGYGFLSENSAFAKRCVEEGLVFIGPPWKAIEAMGNKSRSKEIMINAGVPCIPGYHGANQEPKYLLEEAKKIGFPVMVKAVKGGGGKGMRIAMNEGEFLDKLESAKSEGRNSFKLLGILKYKYSQTNMVTRLHWGNGTAVYSEDIRRLLKKLQHRIWPKTYGRIYGERQGLLLWQWVMKVPERSNVRIVNLRDVERSDEKPSHIRQRH